MKTEVHSSNSRGIANHGWLQSNFSFSFAEYYNPQRMGFGVLRVINDDVIAGGKGVGTHPHQDMEIITIPLEGDLEHKDSMGQQTVIRNGEIQVMSAGTGIYHSEYNKNSDRDVKLLQIWVKPKTKGVTPRYDQKNIKNASGKNVLQQILSPSPDDEGVWIHQNAWFHLGEFDQATEVKYELKSKENGVYVFVIEGEVNVGDIKLSTRDALGIWETEEIKFTASAGAKVLLMDVPMKG
jgi:quercetin 2,3-dioxygenase